MDKEKKSPSRPKRKTTGKPAVFKRARPSGQAIQGIYGDSPMNRPDQILPKEIQISNAKSGKKMKQNIFTGPKKESHVSIPFEREKNLEKKRQERNAAKKAALQGSSNPAQQAAMNAGASQTVINRLASKPVITTFRGIEDGFKTRINPTVKRRNKTKNSLVREKKAKEARRKS